MEWRGRASPAAPLQSWTCRSSRPAADRHSAPGRLHSAARRPSLHSQQAGSSSIKPSSHGHGLCFPGHAAAAPPDAASCRSGPGAAQAEVNSRLTPLIAPRVVQGWAPPLPPLPPPAATLPHHSPAAQAAHAHAFPSSLTCCRLAAVRVQVSAAVPATLPPAVSSAADLVKRAAKDSSVPPKQVFKALRTLEAAKLQPADWNATIGGPPARRWRLVFVAGAKTVTAANKGKSEGGGFYFPLAGVRLLAGWAGRWVVVFVGAAAAAASPAECDEWHATGACTARLLLCRHVRCLGSRGPKPAGRPIVQLSPTPPAAGCQRYDASTGDYQNGIVSAGCFMCRLLCCCGAAGWGAAACGAPIAAAPSALTGAVPPFLLPAVPWAAGGAHL